MPYNKSKKAMNRMAEKVKLMTIGKLDSQLVAQWSSCPPEYYKIEGSNPTAE
jgi:hypothetical protein